MPTCGPLSILFPAMKHWGPPRRQGLGSHYAHMWAISAFVPVQSIGDPRDGRGCVATMPTCGPLFILSPAMKHWGSPRRQGLGSHCAHMWATFYFVPCYEALGTPETAGVR